MTKVAGLPKCDKINITCHNIWQFLFQHCWCISWFSFGKCSNVACQLYRVVVIVAESVIRVTPPMSSILFMSVCVLLVYDTHVILLFTPRTNQIFHFRQYSQNLSMVCIIYFWFHVFFSYFRFHSLVNSVDMYLHGNLNLFPRYERRESA